MMGRFSSGFFIFLGVFGLIALVGGFGGWAASTQLSGAIIAPGKLEVDRNRQVVQHEAGGTVTAIHVEEGDYVAAGDVLLELDTEKVGSELVIVESQYFELLARLARLEAERDQAEWMSFRQPLIEHAQFNVEIAEIMDGQERLFESRLVTLAQEREQLSRRRDQIKNQIEGIDAQLTAIDRQLELIREELLGQRRLLERGLAQGARVLSLEREEAALSGRRGELLASRAAAAGQITENELQDLNLRTQRREDAIAELRDLRYRELELMERRRAVREQLARLEIRAPVAGLVYGLSIQTPGAVLRSAEPVAFIVPQDRPLVIAARVQPVDVDEVYPGQDVHLVFSSIARSASEEMFGKVTLISADAFEDEATGASYYRVEVTLSEGELAKLPEGVEALPGMPVETYIQTHERSALAYLVQPLRDYFNRAFREG